MKIVHKLDDLTAGLEFVVLEHHGLEFTALMSCPKTLNSTSLMVRVTDWGDISREDLYIKMHEEVATRFYALYMREQYVPRKAMN